MVLFSTIAVQNGFPFHAQVSASEGAIKVLLARCRLSGLVAEEVIMIYGPVMHWTFGAFSLPTRNGRLLLFAEMKLPGEAWREFNVKTIDSH